MGVGVEGAFAGWQGAGAAEQQQHSRVANRAELRAEQGRKQGRAGLPVCLSSLFSALLLWVGASRAKGMTGKR